MPRLCGQGDRCEGYARYITVRGYRDDTVITRQRWYRHCHWHLSLLKTLIRLGKKKLENCWKLFSSVFVICFDNYSTPRQKQYKLLTFNLCYIFRISVIKKELSICVLFIVTFWQLFCDLVYGLASSVDNHNCTKTFFQKN